jgi:hypothetical protein
MNASRRLFLLLALGSLVGAVGCGGEPDGKPLDMGGEDGTKIATVIEDVNEAIGNPKKLDILFVKGSKPTDTKKFARGNYSIAGKPSVSGESATAKVRVDSSEGKLLGEVEWKLEKDGDKWKIKDAPIP